MKEGRKLFKLQGDVSTNSNDCGLVMGKVGLQAEEVFHMSFLSQK